MIKVFPIELNWIHQNDQNQTKRNQQSSSEECSCFGLVFWPPPIPLWITPSGVLKVLIWPLNAGSVNFIWVKCRFKTFELRRNNPALTVYA